MLYPNYMELHLTGNEKKKNTTQYFGKRGAIWEGQKYSMYIYLECQLSTELLPQVDFLLHDISVASNSSL